MNQRLKAEIVAGFFRHRIAMVNTSEPFRLASGSLSPVYLDHRRIFSVPELRGKVVTLWADVVRAEVGDPSVAQADLVVAGTATAGIAPAYALASKLESRFVYVRSKAKEHGLGRMVEGVWAPGDGCIVVDDMVTTGGSLLEASARIRDERGKPLLATSITRHDFARTRERFEKEGLALVSCFTSRELFTLAAQGGFLSEEDLATVLAWLDSQAN